MRVLRCTFCVRSDQSTPGLPKQGRERAWLHWQPWDAVHRNTDSNPKPETQTSRAVAANDIEHGVLRGNAASPASPFVLLGLPQFAGRTFGKGDPRLPQVRPWPCAADRHARTVPDCTRVRCVALVV